MDAERLAEWEREHEAVLRALSDPDVVADHARLRDASRRHKDLEALIGAGRSLRRAEEDVAAARDMVAEAPADDRDLARGELERAESERAELEEELR